MKKLLVTQPTSPKWLLRLKRIIISFVFRSLNRTFDLRSKVGCTSEMKRKTSFSFAFRSVCTTFAPNIIEKEICTIRIILGKQECSNR